VFFFIMQFYFILLTNETGFIASGKSTRPASHIIMQF